MDLSPKEQEHVSREEVKNSALADEGCSDSSWEDESRVQKKIELCKGAMTSAPQIGVEKGRFVAHCMPFSLWNQSRTYDPGGWTMSNISKTAQTFESFI